MRVAVTGAGGRLGRALISALADAPFTGLAGPIAWTRPDYDLDDVEAPSALIERDRPEVVVHCAAWTDVDGAARDEGLADRRNTEASARLADACAGSGVDLIYVSTNEVFDGKRTDGHGYRPDDPTGPINAYGVSKLGGELAARAIASGGRSLSAIVRTAWLYGPPGNDFPSKIVAAALRARAAGEPLKVVGDEFGSPTSAADVAEAIVELIGSGEIGGTLHYVDVGAVSRADWAREIVRLARVDVAIEEVPASTWPRPSTPPRWGVLAASPLPSGEPMRPWTEALADYAPFLRRLASAPMADAPAGRSA
jgi:dTDP-4-dehydrorhamnose reductase